MGRDRYLACFNQVAHELPNKALQRTAKRPLSLVVMLNKGKHSGNFDRYCVGSINIYGNRFNWQRKWHM